MNKSNKNIFGLFFLLCIGCKEIPPVIDLSEKAIGLNDKTYIESNIPFPVKKKIFIEDITGVRCPSCPNAAVKISEIEDINPNKVITMSLYPNALAQFMTPWPGFEALNTNVADDIFAQIYGSPGVLPAGGINRKIFSGESSLNLHYTKWSGYADKIKSEESPVIISGEVLEIDTIKNKVKIWVKITFVKNVKEEVNLSLFLTESKILSKQATSTVAKDDYQHNHVLRKSLTPFNGAPLKINASSNGNYEAGRTFEKSFEVEFNAKWKKENSAFVILVNRYDTGNKEVLQAEELDLK